jgi:HEAT repeat protein
MDEIWFGKLPMKSQLELHISYYPTNPPTVTIEGDHYPRASFVLTPEMNEALKGLFDCARRDTDTILGNLCAKDERVQLAAIAALARNGPLAQKGVPQLRDLLHHERATIRIQAARALFTINANLGAAQLLLTELTRSKPNVRVEAGRALVSIAHLLELKDIAPLLSALRDDEEDVRRYAARILGYMKKNSEASIPALLLALQDPQWAVRSQAAHALGSLQVSSVEIVRHE